jgi:hypothetical protein
MLATEVEFAKVGILPPATPSAMRTRAALFAYGRALGWRRTGREVDREAPAPLGLHGRQLNPLDQVPHDLSREGCIPRSCVHPAGPRPATGDVQHALFLCVASEPRLHQPGQLALGVGERRLVGRILTPLGPSADSPHSALPVLCRPTDACLYRIGYCGRRAAD